MSEAALKLDERYTWADYCKWPDGERWEIIGGEAFDMSPAPTLRHQAIVGEIYFQFASAFRDKKCKVFVSPADIKLSESDVVEPDVFVVCDEERIKRTHIEGAPTLVIEVLSPSTEKKDRTIKMDLYASSGVKEIWVVDPDGATVEVFSLDSESYRLAGKHGENDKVTSVVFPELSVDLRRVFDFPDEPKARMARIKEDPEEYGGPGAERRE